MIYHNYHPVESGVQTANDEPRAKGMELRFLHWKITILMGMVVGLSLAGCESITLRPFPAVPTQRMLPYTVSLEVSSLNIYWVEPGAGTWPLPPIRSFITAQPPSANLDKTQWENILINYLNNRKTFQHLIKQDDNADLILDLRVHLFIDPGASFKFDYSYWARIDGVIKIAQYDREVARQTGTGKAHGDMTHSNSQDENFLNEAVFQALDTLITKFESDRQLHPSLL